MAMLSVSDEATGHTCRTAASFSTTLRTRIGARVDISIEDPQTFRLDNGRQRIEIPDSARERPGQHGFFKLDMNRPPEEEEGSAVEDEALSIGIYRDRRDRLRASPDVFPTMLADFLETDVREDPDWCETLLQGLDLARGGEAFEATGNLYELQAGPDGVLLRNGGDRRRAPLRLAVIDLKRALAAWRRAIG